MAVEYFVRGQPQHAHEEQALLNLAQLMQRALAASDRFYLLAANVHLWRTQADALVLAPRAITLLELKSCSDPVYGRAQGPWRVLPDGGVIRGGSRDNPYQQIVAARETLTKYLDRNRRRFLDGARARAMAGRWGQTSAALVFAPHLNPASDVIVPPQSRAWLGVIGLNETAEFLFSRFAPQVDLFPQELRRLATEALGCRPWSEVQSLLPPAPHCGYLWLLDEAGQRTYAHPVVDETSIGRSRDNTLVAPRRASRASRQHALLRVLGDTAWLYDNDSTHGTFVNGERLSSQQGQQLYHGDSITLGDLEHPGACRLRFERRGRVEGVTESTLL